MNYIETTNGKVTFTHYLPFDPVYGLGKTEAELLETGYLVEEIPEYVGEVPEAQQAATNQAVLGLMDMLAEVSTN